MLKVILNLFDIKFYLKLNFYFEINKIKNKSN